MVTQDSFGERLLWARSKAGLTQKELSDKSGISLPQIVRYEAGKATPRLRSAMRLGRVLGIDPYDLMPDLKQNVREVEIPVSSELSENLEHLSKLSGMTIEEVMHDLIMQGIKAYQRGDESLLRALEEKRSKNSDKSE